MAEANDDRSFFGRLRKLFSTQAVVRIDTPGEADYFRHGGILQYVLRSLAKA